jgi:hypothetical protein
MSGPAEKYGARDYGDEAWGSWSKSLSAIISKDPPLEPPKSSIYGQNVNIFAKDAPKM